MAKRNGKKNLSRAATASASAPATRGSGGSADNDKKRPANRVDASPLRRFFAKEWVQVGAIVIAAFALRLVNLLFMRANSPFFDAPVTDADFYNKLAVQISNGDWVGNDVFFHNPLYPYFLAVLYKLFGQSFLLVKLIQITLGSLSVGFIYFIAKRLVGRSAAIIAAGMAAGYLIFIFYDELLLATSLSVFTFLAALLLLLRTLDNASGLRFATAGVVLGISFVARPSLFPFIAAAWIVFVLRRRTKLFVFSRLAIYGTFAALMVLPVTVRNYVVGDDIVLISAHTGYNIYLGNNPDAGGYLRIPPSIPRTLIDNPVDQRQWFAAQAEKVVGRKLKPSEISAYWSAEGWSYITSHPLDWLRLAGKKVLCVLNSHEASDNQNFYFSMQYSPMLRLPLVGFGLVCPLALLGMVLLLRDWRRVGILHLYVVTYIGTLLLFFVNSRYRMLLLPVFMIFAGHALVWTVDKLRRKEFKPFLKAAALLIAFAFVTFYKMEGVSTDPHYIDYYNVGNKYVLKERIDEAIEAFSISIKIHPGYISSHNNLASAYEKAGRIDDAIAEWKIVQNMGEKIQSKVHIQRASQHIDLLNRKKK